VLNRFGDISRRRIVGRPTPNLQGPRDVFQALFAAVRESSLQAVADILMHSGGYRHAARRRDLLQAGGDVDAVAQNIIAVDDDVAQIDANAECDAVIFLDVGIACRHALLHFDHALGGIHHGGEFQQQAIAHGFDDAAAVALDQCVDQFRAMAAQVGKRAGFVHAHQPGIANHVGRNNGRQSALSAL
jgi:hypothetical protein